MGMGRETSRTAETVVWLRAMGALEADQERRNPDDLAIDLLGGPLRALRHVPGGWPLARRVFSAMAPGYYEYEIARTKHLDAVLMREARHLEQLVLIGSGFDSRPYRFAGPLSTALVFEVDRPPVLAAKRRRARRAGLGSESIVEVAVDLAHDSLETLEHSGYDPEARTLFICSGVLMHLDAEAVDRFFAFVHAAAPGSSVCFDYVYRAALEESERFYGAERMVRNVNRVGESDGFALDPDELAGFLTARGCHVISHLDAAALGNYLGASPPGEAAPMCDYLGIVHAAVSTRGEAEPVLAPTPDNHISNAEAISQAGGC